MFFSLTMCCHMLHLPDKNLFCFIDSKAEDSFLNRMRYYMPPKHRAFIEAVEQGPSIRNFGKIVAIAAV